MGKLILPILVATFIASCARPKPKGELHECVVTRVTWEYQYSWAPDRIYTIENNCGYTVKSKHSAIIGDTIQVLVVDAKNYFRK